MLDRFEENPEQQGMRRGGGKPARPREEGDQETPNREFLKRAVGSGWLLAGSMEVAFRVQIPQERAAFQRDGVPFTLNIDGNFGGIN